MNENKLKRIVVSSTVGAVLLIITLLLVMVYQIIAIAVEKRDYQELQAAIAELEELKEDGLETLEYRQTKVWIERRARELGYKYKGDKT